jgi:pilus assembly protein CpaB
VVGVAGFLLPGNRVDVLAIRGGRGNTRATTDTVLHNIKVLAVDQTTATEKNDPIIVRAVTLELSPDQALVLVKAKAEGEIQLTLRNPVDTQVAKTEAPEPAPVVKPARVYARAAPSSTTIQVIRGTHVGKVKTEN